MEQFVTNKDYAIVYIRNGLELIFPVKDMEHAINLANSIAESDLLNDHIDFNCFDLCEYNKKTNEIGESWESQDYESFDEYWQFWRNYRS